MGLALPGGKWEPGDPSIEATAARSHAILPGVGLEERSIEEAACTATIAALRSWTV